MKEELEILKKLQSYSLKRAKFVEKWCKDYTISLLCQLLEISKNVYYFYTNKPLTTVQIKNNYLKQKITNIF